ncbi:hypothetical protein CRG98_039578 [Punica granatum]|uniref:Uncharacterized protein n=1 Tax=Punica granatum TaxID=22663 RepID=A0A2I0I7P1_PUNGR|nr:hypothetical protein CRG98_039578 [Punica granatum]
MKPKTIISIPFLGPATAPISFPHDCSYLAWTCRDIALGIKTGVDPKETWMDPEENRIDLKETRIDLNWKLKAGVRTRMWTLVEARIARFWIARLGSVHLPVGTRDGHA